MRGGSRSRLVAAAACLRSILIGFKASLSFVPLAYKRHYPQLPRATTRDARRSRFSRINDILVTGVVVLEESPCPCPWTTKSLNIVKDFTFCKQTVMYDHMKSINSVTATMHEDKVKNVLLTDVRYYLLIHVSK